MLTTLSHAGCSGPSERVSLPRRDKGFYAKPRLQCLSLLCSRRRGPANTRHESSPGWRYHHEANGAAELDIVIRERERQASRSEQTFQLRLHDGAIFSRAFASQEQPHRPQCAPSPCGTRERPQRQRCASSRIQSRAAIARWINIGKRRQWTRCQP